MRKDIEEFVIKIPYALNRIIEPSDGQTPSLYLLSRIIERDILIIIGNNGKPRFQKSTTKRRVPKYLDIM